MKKYKVSLQESLQNENSDHIVFECMADDEDHAQEKAVDAYFGCVINSIEEVSPQFIMVVEGGCVSYFHNVSEFHNDFKVLVLDYDNDYTPEIPDEFSDLAGQAGLI